MYEQADHYTIKAKKLGYPARSVFKLMEIEQKFHIIPKTGRILDIGAAPGSWSLYILSRLDAGGFLCACDLQDLAEDKRFEDQRFVFFKGDAFENPNRDQITQNGPYELLVSDAAPSTTGNRMVDTARSENLIDSLIYHGLPNLKPGGSFVAKIFQGGAEKKFLAALRPLFDSCHLFKPQACRKTSFETFLVAVGKKG